MLPFGAFTERHVPQASRGICERGVDPRRHRRAGDARLSHAAVHLVAESLSRVAPARTRAGGGRPAGKRHRVCRSTAGAARRPTYPAPASGRCPTTRLRARSHRVNPFWTTLVRDDERFRVYLMNDRGGIYALGYPSITWFGHLSASRSSSCSPERSTSLLLIGAALFAFIALDHHRPSGRALLREVPVELLSQAVPRVRGRRGRAGRDPGARRPDLLRQPRHGPESKTRPRRPRPSRSGWSRTTPGCNSSTRRRRRRSTIRSWSSSAAPSIRT